MAGPAPLAGRVPVSALRRGQIVARAGNITGVCGVWEPDIGHCRDDISGHPDALVGLVSGDVVGDDAEERSQCPGLAAGVGPEELRDGLDVAA